MARTKDKARHEEIAWKAVEAIRARGVHGVTMSDVANDLSMKRSSLYWYFDSLDAIFEAVLERTLERLSTFVADRVADIDHPIDLIDAWMTAVVAFYDDDPDLIAVLTRFWALGSGRSPEAVFERTRAFFEPIHAGAVEMLQEGMRTGTVGSCQPAALIDLCAATVDGLVVHQVSRNIDPHRGLAVFRKAVLEPLARRPARPSTAGWSVEED